MGRSKKTRKLQKRVEEKESAKRRILVEEQRPWSDLPTELLMLVESSLSLEDSIRFSCVCKNWHSLHRSHRVVNQSPLLLFPQLDDGLCEFFDPSQRKSYFRHIPELVNAVICCSKDGWLLLSKIDGISLLNPLTKSKIDLPYFDPYQFDELEVTLSCGPTSPGCMVFAIGDTNPDVSISIWHYGDAQWTNINFQNDLHFPVCGSTPVFCGGLFYCLNNFSFNMVGVFDPKEYTWSILTVPQPIQYIRRRYQWRAVYMAECKGELLFVHILYPAKPTIFKLDLSEMRWIEIRSLDGETLFVSGACSLSESEIPRILRNSVYLPRFRRYGNRCYFYSLEYCRYYPTMQCPDWKRDKLFSAVWIQPPKVTQPLFEELD
ncbi:F-box/kelch-repeat protein At1g57790-like [Macadamia integrifolia]|uniref:F-box/kelch-repeat protein At1g57790-like n=1 Tax=Macadamia integrifolia TaxID=60698 RepID=UPI001C4EBBE0|nr:F-box/kelch-repeat protein At1g57790-like [Macadamia integrifolia]